MAPTVVHAEGIEHIRHIDAYHRDACTQRTSHRMHGQAFKGTATNCRMDNGSSPLIFGSKRIRVEEGLVNVGRRNLLEVVAFVLRVDGNALADATRVTTKSGRIGA